MRNEIAYTEIPINSKRAEKYIEYDPYLSKYSEYLSENSGEILIDIDEDKIIGYIFVGVTTDPGFISTLEVKPQYRGYGFGTILLRDAINKYDAVDLEVKKDNEIAINLYKKFNFKVISEGRNSDYIYMKR